MNSIFTLLKWLPALLKGKDVAEAYKAETGKDKPVIISKRFIGAIVILASVAVSIQYGVTIDQDVLDKLTGSLTDLATVGTGLYGLIMVIKGVFDAKKRKPTG